LHRIGRPLDDAETMSIYSLLRVMDRATRRSPRSSAAAMTARLLQAAVDGQLNFR
jgi:hypothetical protein